VEATKQVYRAIPAHRERARLIPALPPVLVPSSFQQDELYMPSPLSPECTKPLTIRFQD
jgi:hypothetical protein